MLECPRLLAVSAMSVWLSVSFPGSTVQWTIELESSWRGLSRHVNIDVMPVSAVVISHDSLNPLIIEIFIRPKCSIDFSPLSHSHPSSLQKWPLTSWSIRSFTPSSFSTRFSNGLRISFSRQSPRARARDRVVPRLPSSVLESRVLRQRLIALVMALRLSSLKLAPRIKSGASGV